MCSCPSLLLLKLYQQPLTCLAPVPVTPVSHMHHVVMHSPALSTPERVKSSNYTSVTPPTPLLTAASPYSIPAIQNVAHNDFDRAVQENQMLRNELKKLREETNSFMKCTKEHFHN